MKTEQEVRDGIAHLESDIELALGCGKTGRTYVEMTQAQVRILSWVLGDDIGTWYWCSKCDLSHEGQACPRCWNSRVIEGFEHSYQKEGD